MTADVSGPPNVKAHLDDADQICDALADVDASRAPDAAAQEKLWRAALKCANRARKTAGDSA